jgi:hypothetical protein
VGCWGDAAGCEGKAAATAGQQSSCMNEGSCMEEGAEPLQGGAPGVPCCSSSSSLVQVVCGVFCG